MPTKAVIFDLDGTIVFSHPTHFVAYEKLFAEFGIIWSYREFNDLFAGIGARAIIHTILTRHGVEHFDLDALVTKKRDIFNELLSHKKLQTVPGFFAFLEEVKRGNLKKTIASGSHTENIHSMLKNIGVDSDFPVITSGEEVPHPKPAPDIFIKAAEKLAASPDTCLVIEDTTHGVLAAKLAGMKCIALKTTTEAERLLEAGADMLAEDYDELLRHEVI